MQSGSSSLPDLAMKWPALLLWEHLGESLPAISGCLRIARPADFLQPLRDRKSSLGGLFCCYQCCLKAALSTHRNANKQFSKNPFYFGFMCYLKPISDSQIIDSSDHLTATDTANKNRKEGENRRFFFTVKLGWPPYVLSSKIWL